jgi:NifU-like protein involved in Fe-S cluster formation
MNGPWPNAGCCGNGRLPTLSDYIDGGLRRSRLTESTGLGAACRDEAGHVVRFGVHIADGVVTKVGFRASTCVTLVAYCELAAQRVSGQRVAEALRTLQPADIARALPSVPPVKRDRAQLAARALVIALLEKARDQQP